MPRMEDAAFNQKTSAEILSIKEKKDQQIKVPYWIGFGVVSEHLSATGVPQKIFDFLMYLLVLFCRDLRVTER